MPGAPGSSLACKECRKQRRKCDLQQPHCLRCRRNNVLCSGPREYPTFVHARIDGSTLQGQRQTLADTIRDNKSQNKNSHQLLRAVKLQNGRFFDAMRKNEWDSLLARNFSLPNVPFAPVFIAVLDEFKEDKDVGIFTVDRTPLQSERECRLYSAIALSIRALLKLATPAGHDLNVAIFALLILYLGRLKGDDGMLQLSRRAYGSTLAQMRTTISKLPDFEGAAASVSILVACQAMSLRLYELFDHIEPPHPNSLIHEDAVARLMRMLGPSAFASREIRQLLQGLRTFAINDAIINRRHTIFAETEWIKLTAGDPVWSPRQSLMDIASAIPNIITDTTYLLQESDRVIDDRHEHHHQQANTLLRQISILHAQFEAWLIKFESLYDGPLFWNSMNGNYTGTAHHDLECRPKQTPIHSQLCFHSAPVAGVLVAYSSFRLKLWMLAADIRNWMEHNDGIGFTRAMERTMRRERELAGKTAWLILEAMPYLQSCFEGSIVLQAPLRIAEEFYRDNGSLNRAD